MSGSGTIRPRVEKTLLCSDSISCRSARSTLLRPPGLTNTGIEPDSCYYIEHEPESRNPGDQLDLSQVPPPDLLIEVVVSHGPKEALEICRLLGIPEVWVYRPRRATLQFLQLEDGKYVTRKRSRSFPFLGPEDVIPWLTSTDDEPDNRWRRRLRDWVRDVLAPRRAGG
jgi:Uma2 family endonuclease